MFIWVYINDDWPYMIDPNIFVNSLKRVGVWTFDEMIQKSEFDLGYDLGLFAMLFFGRYGLGGMMKD